AQDVETPLQHKQARRWHVRDYGILVGLVAIVIYLSVTTSTFLTGANLANVLDQAVVVGLLACGATLCIVSGVFDLTASATLALAAIIGVKATGQFGVLGGFVVAVLAGALLGGLTGTIVVRSGVNSFIATLAIAIVYRGLAVVITAGAIASPLADQLTGFQVFTRHLGVGGITNATVVLIIVVILTGVLLSRTTFGRRVYAVGGNTEAARLSGIRVGQVHIAVYMVSGICSALAGLVLASQAGSAQASLATGMELSAIAAAIIGGTSVLGGEGAIWRGMIGVLMLTLIANGFNLLGWDTTYQQVVQGCLILIAVTVDRYLRRRNA
ncbi:MAG: monosaccharide transporter rane protein family, partial [Blastococcus sp.]|nr:monosaccharide transporter rane protein family [Blastococcus sp.]